jgi:hypothetical protein
LNLDETFVDARETPPKLQLVRDGLEAVAHIDFLLQFRRKAVVDFHHLRTPHKAVVLPVVAFGRPATLSRPGTATKNSRHRRRVRF